MPPPLQSSPFSILGLPLEVEFPGGATGVLALKQNNCLSMGLSEITCLSFLPSFHQERVCRDNGFLKLLPKWVRMVASLQKCSVY